MAEAVKPKKKSKAKTQTKCRTPVTSLVGPEPNDEVLYSKENCGSHVEQLIPKPENHEVTTAHIISRSESNPLPCSLEKTSTRSSNEELSSKGDHYEDLFSISSQNTSEDVNGVSSKATSASFSFMTSGLQQLEATEALAMKLETLSVDEGPFDVGFQLKSVTSAPELFQEPTEGEAPMEALLENPYSGFQDTLSSVESQQVEPSAPTPVAVCTTIEDGDPHHFELDPRLAESPGEMYSEPTVQELITEVDHRQQLLAQQYFVKPYTMSQLRGLFPLPLLEDCEEYSDAFVAAWSRNQDDHELYQILTSYFKALTALQADLGEFEEFQKKADSEQSTLWTHRTEKVTEDGVCGDSRGVVASHEYQIAIFESEVHSNLTKTLKKTREILSDKIALRNYSVALHRLQAYNYVHNALVCCDPNELRVCISILFAFQRQPIRIREFLLQTREWLSILVAALFQFRNVEDHLFLLHHILRCPSGVSKWAASFLQAPLLSDVQGNVDIFLALLETLLTPVEAKDAFLSCWDSKTDESFVWLDSDGEDEEGSSALQLSEDDLSAILRQIPWTELIRTLMSIETRDGRDQHGPIEWNDFLKVLTLAKELAWILRKGVYTYASLRYKHFVKKICQLLQHVLLFVCEHWETALQASLPWDQPMWYRLQAEFDHLFLTIALVLLRSKKWGGWQFLSSLPYQLLSSNTLWELYMACQRADEWDKLDSNSGGGPGDDLGLSNVNWADQLRDEQLWLQLSEGLAALPEAEVFWLLMTFANMAIARNAQTEYVFLRLVVWEIFEIGYVDSLTREIASKGARELLSNVLSKHPTLFTFLLTRVESVIAQMGKSALYLFKELPLALWQVDDADLKILRHWALEYELGSPEQKLSWMILASLSYKTLPCRISEQVALLLVELWEKHASSSENWSWIQPTEFQSWAKQLVLRLKLHSSQTSMERTLVGAKALDQYPTLRTAVIAKNLMASYVELMLTDVGDNVPLFCEEGIDLLTLLVTGGWVSEALHVLHTICPMFLSCPEVLHAEPKFIECIKHVLDADTSYMKIARNFIASGLPGKLLQTMGSMLEDLLLRCAAYGLPNPKPWIQLWQPVFLKIPKWEKDRNVFYLLDIIARASLSCTETRQTVFVILKESMENMPMPKSGRWSSVMSWSSTPLQPWPSPSTLWSTFPHLAWMVLEVEYSLQMPFWKQIAKELSSTNKSLDQVVKHVASSQKHSCGMLCVTSYANWILQCPDDLPFLPLLWQRLFSFYFMRTDSEHGSLGLKIIDKNTLTKLIAKTTELTSKFPNQPLYQVFETWLRDTRLVEANLYIPSLPRKYAPELLLLIDSERLWWEYVNWSSLNEQWTQLSSQWRREKEESAEQQIRTVSPSEKILLRLQNYPCPLSSSSSVKPSPVLRPISYNLLINVSSLEALLEPHLSPIISTSSNFCESVNWLTALDCGVLEMMPEEWTREQMTIVKKVACHDSMDKTKTVVPCQGRAVIPLEFSCEKRQDAISQRIAQNRDERRSVVKKMLQPPCDRYVIAAMIIQCVVRELQSRRAEQGIQKAGSYLFYRLVGTVTEETNFFPPSKQLLSTALEALGHTFIAGHPKECAALLSLMETNPHLAGILAPHFTPQSTTDGFSETAAFLEAYRLVACVSRAHADLQFVLLTKFDVGEWLESKFCSSANRAKLLHLILETITGFGLEPVSKCHALHELYRRHLRSVLMFNFPENYFHVLSLLLKASSSQSLCPVLWYDFINTVGRGLDLSEDTSWEQVHMQLIRSAPEAASHDVKLWLESVHVLSRHFSSERSLFGLYGLYPKYRPYVPALAAVLAWVCHAFVCAAVAQDRGSNSDHLSEKLWFKIREMFSPWIIPYSQQEVNSSCATWIQQLSNDRRILLPWIQSDANVAGTILKAFEVSVSFLHTILPATRNVLTHVWNLYTHAFCFAAVKSYVLVPLHDALLNLPWADFYPSHTEIEHMSRVCSQYLPDQHGFVARILPRLSWANILQLLKCHEGKDLSRTMGALLQTFVRMSAEPTARQGDAFCRLLGEACNFAWASLHIESYEEIWQWCILSLDPRLALMSRKGHTSLKGLEDVQQIDIAVYKLLKAASGYVLIAKPGFHPGGLHIGVLYVKGWVRMFQTCYSRHKLLMNKPGVIQVTVVDVLEEYDKIAAVNPRAAEPYFKELIQLIRSGNGLGEACLIAFRTWIQKRKTAHVLEHIRILSGLGWPPVSMPNVASVMEALLESYFKSSEESCPSTWSALETCVIGVNSSLLLASLDQSLLLTFVCLLREKVRNAHGLQELLELVTLVLNASKTIKSSDGIEPKLIPLWIILLNILAKIRSCDLDVVQEEQLKQVVRQTSESLAALREESQGWKFLGLLGRSSFLSDKGKLVSTIVGCLAEFFSKKETFEVKQSVSTNLEKLKSVKAYSEHSAYIDSIVASFQNESGPETMPVLNRILAALYSENYVVMSS